MRVLIDTHVYLWWLDNPKFLSTKAIKLIENPKNTIFISAAVSWEIAIKTSIGKLEVPSTVMNYIEEEGFVELPITVKHTNALLSLESYHKDPFDRILIAQAKVEKLVFITRDEMSLKYSGLKLVKA